MPKLLRSILPVLSAFLLACASVPAQQPAPAAPGTAQLLIDLSQLIDSTRQRVARTVNAELVSMYWKIGGRIRRNILGQERSAHGERIVSTLSRQLSARLA